MSISKVFEKQSALMNNYHVIETRVCGPLNHPTRVLHNHEQQNVHTQEHIRLIIWRGIEEMREAGRELRGSPEFKTELIDALHFFTEACLFCNLSWAETSMCFQNVHAEREWKDYGRNHMGEPYHRSLAHVVSAFADATYLLKSKPWKQTPKETDWKAFIIKLAQAYEEFLTLLRRHMTYDEAMELYFGKAAENVQRQETGY